MLPEGARALVVPSSTAPRRFYGALRLRVAGGLAPVGGVAGRAPRPGPVDRHGSGGLGAGRGGRGGRGRAAARRPGGRSPGPCGKCRRRRCRRCCGVGSSPGGRGLSRRHRGLRGPSGNPTSGREARQGSRTAVPTASPAPRRSRIQRYLSQAGAASRRQAEVLIGERRCPSTSGCGDGRAGSPGQDVVGGVRPRGGEAAHRPRRARFPGPSRRDRIGGPVPRGRRSP